jgi:5-methylcytosine-specific restriction endonuclease McrA
MSKKFKGKTCAYCGEREAITGDHVFAREFFLPSDRADLPQAPICGECNNEKSKLEHYLTTVLPFGGRHPASAENLS